MKLQDIQQLQRQNATLIAENASLVTHKVTLQRENLIFKGSNESLRNRLEAVQNQAYALEKQVEALQRELKSEELAFIRLRNRHVSMTNLLNCVIESREALDKMFELGRNRLDLGNGVIL